MRTNFLWAKLILTMLIILSVSFIYADCRLLGMIGFNAYDLNDLVSHQLQSTLDNIQLIV